MPSMGDTVFIFLLALMLLGPKKLPQLARQLGKLMAEFRKASNDFRMQMEDELRLEEQKEHQRKAAELPPPTPAAAVPPDQAADALPSDALPSPEMISTTPLEEQVAVTPIAESGSLKMMPPASGLPMEGRNRRTASFEDAAELPIPEHSFAGDHLGRAGSGMSSDEPMADLEPFPATPKSTEPVMADEGEHATHA